MRNSACPACLPILAAQPSQAVTAETSDGRGMCKGQMARPPKRCLRRSSRGRLRVTAPTIKSMRPGRSTSRSTARGCSTSRSALNAGARITSSKWRARALTIRPKQTGRTAIHPTSDLENSATHSRTIGPSGGDDPVLTGGRSGGSDPFDSTTDAANGVTQDDQDGLAMTRAIDRTMTSNPQGFHSYIDLVRANSAADASLVTRSASPCMPPGRALLLMRRSPQSRTPPAAAFWSSSDMQTLRSRTLPRSST